MCLVEPKYGLDVGRRLGYVRFEGSLEDDWMFQAQATAFVDILKGSQQWVPVLVLQPANVQSLLRTVQLESVGKTGCCLKGDGGTWPVGV